MYEQAVANTRAKADELKARLQDFAVEAAAAPSETAQLDIAGRALAWMSGEAVMAYASAAVFADQLAAVQADLDTALAQLGAVRHATLT